MRRKISFLIILAFIVLIVPSAASAEDNETITEDADDGTVDIIIESDDNIHLWRVEEFDIHTTVLNAGKNTAHNTQVICIMPTAIKYVSSKATKGSYSENTGLWKIGDLKSGEKANLTITAIPPQLGIHTVMFKAESDDADIDLSNNIAKTDVDIHTRVGPVSREDDVRTGDNHVLYSVSAYSQYRQVTQSTDLRVEAKMEETPTANPIMLGLISIATLIGISFRKNRF